MSHVSKTMADTLPDDPWHSHFNTPDWLKALIANGALGQKTGAGIFRKIGKTISVLDIGKADYRPATGQEAAEVVAILKLKDQAEKSAKLRPRSTEEQRVGEKCGSTCSPWGAAYS